VLLDQLGLTSEQIAACPQIEPLLKQCGISSARVIEVLRADTQTESIKVVQLWDSMTPANRNFLGMEGFALGTGISPRRLWELYCGAGLIQTKEVVGAMIADALPQIMRVTIKDAKKVKGLKSREHILKASRILPTAKGTVINLPGANNQLTAGDEDDADDGEGDLEPADDFLMRASRAMGVKALPASVVEAESEDEDDG
jgi:hypothetical protein